MSGRSSKKSMTNAIEEAVALNENSRDITAAFYGSWQKRGHTSLNGVITATSLDNGKVIDVECLTKFCHNCKSDQPGHVCMKNYDGFSGGMESDGVVKIFQRSENLYQSINANLKQTLEKFRGRGCCLTGLAVVIDGNAVVKRACERPGRS
ncbi:hypothetical protein ANN_16296 [Periplaneta americana]|uniref:Mutator-like transposase domain-containing protein n=1 Tax=Periplaneta americana TaxID=6978 RepID=A0ABQ8SIP2_PERAM|nr:hypothetical protein ANN_16296 [Periplaneta americana]